MGLAPAKTFGLVDIQDKGKNGTWKRFFSYLCYRYVCAGCIVAVGRLYEKNN